MERKVVLITGGAMGQGKAHALKYAQNGFDVVLADMQGPEGETFKATVAEIEAAGAKALAVKCNICSDEDMQNLFAKAWETFGRLDVVIANAGVINFGYTWELTDAQVEKVINIDLIGEMCEWAADLGIEYIEFANIQYYNWALLNRDELLPSLEQIRQAEATVNAWRAKLGKRMTLYFVVPDYFEGRPKACMNGWGAIHLTIAPDGVAMPCQESRVIPGLEFESVRERSLAWLWHESPLFRKYRGLDWLPEPCQSCSEKEKDFGGCRCQAFLLTGDAGNTDPACSRSPFHHRITEAVKEVVRPLRFKKPLVKRSASAVSTTFMEE